MSVSEYPKVLVSEVGPRDGLQSIQAVMPTAGKLRWITALAAAGLREIEVGSFVPARLLPQMADVREVVAHARAIPGLHVAALAPNLRGAEGAFDAGVHKLTLPVSVTEAHSLANIRKTPAQMIDEVRAIVALRDARYPSVQIEAGVSVAFGCTIAGRRQRRRDARDGRRDGRMRGRRNRPVRYQRLCEPRPGAPAVHAAAA